MWPLDFLNDVSDHLNPQTILGGPLEFLNDFGRSLEFLKDFGATGIPKRLVGPLEFTNECLGTQEFLNGLGRPLRTRGGGGVRVYRWATYPKVHIDWIVIHVFNNATLLALFA